MVGFGNDLGSDNPRAPEILAEVGNHARVVQRPVRVHTFLGETHLRSHRLDTHLHDFVGNRIVRDDVDHISKQGASGFYQAIRPVRGCGQPVLVLCGQAVENLEIPRHLGRASADTVRFVHDDDIPVIPIPRKVEVAHGLNRGEGHARTKMNLALGDRAEHSFIHVPFGAFLALVQQVGGVAEPQGGIFPSLDESNSHLGLSASSCALEHPVLGLDHRVHRFGLVIVEGNRFAVVYFWGFLKRRCDLGAFEHRHNGS